MSFFNADKANNKLVQQFIKDSGQNCYEDFDVVNVVNHGTFSKAEISIPDDSDVVDFVTFEILDLISYVAFKSGVINL